jgi:guanosine-3',5'-bis(diphosphate) 3'-pyrophosphohydrolase
VTSAAVTSSDRSLEDKASKAPRYLRQYELIDLVKGYDPSADESLLNRAYVYAVRMHGSQRRASGDPYFAHPIEVAGILAGYRMDTASIVTALLHDVIEDTDVTAADIANLFGDEIASLVEGVTKLSKLEFTAERARQAENLRKFILAISKDVRVLMVKLADRLHNMRTLGFVGPAKRERISRETLDIYAPLARSIGCHRICTELEELAFQHLNPVGRSAIMRRLEGLRTDQGGIVAKVRDDIEVRLRAQNIEVEVTGREKQPYSIWRKLQRKHLAFSQLSDIYAFRVIVGTEDQCYAALGVIHRTWPCLPDRFKDYISTPKRNNYRSLHTTVIGNRGLRIEMQIRTEGMDRVAEDGVAAHWRYKNKSYGFDLEGMEAEGGRDPLVTLRQLVQVLEHGGDAEDLLEHTRLEMYLDQVFVFTPKGRLISLPSGAMPLDFAYAVHSGVGDSAVGVKINGELRPLRTQLNNGDVVEVIRNEKQLPPEDWRSLAVTGRARSAIRRRIRQSERDQFIRLGSDALDQALEKVSKSRAQIKLSLARERFVAATDDDLMAALGQGRVRMADLLDVVLPEMKASERLAVQERRLVESGEEARLFVRGSGLKTGTELKFAACCSPLPGDRIVGIHDSERSITVHTIECTKLADFEDRDDLWCDLHWTAQAEQSALGRGRARLTIRNTPGVLGEVCSIIGQGGGNIVNLNMHHRQRDFFDVDFEVDVQDNRHLTHILAALRACPSVETAERALD